MFSGKYRYWWLLQFSEGNYALKKMKWYLESGILNEYVNPSEIMNYIYQYSIERI